MNVTYQYRITNAETGEVFEGKTKECAERIGVKASSFLTWLSQQRHGLQRNRKWRIEVVKRTDSTGRVSEDESNLKTLCWRCKRARLIAGVACSWAERFEPVDGWQAIATHRNTDYNGVASESYCVKSCPQFLED